MTAIKSDFTDRVYNSLPLLRGRVYSLYKADMVGIVSRDELLGKIDKIKSYLPWCVGCLGAEEMESATKKMMGSLYVEIAKLEKELTEKYSQKGNEVGKNKKRRKEQLRREIDIAEQNKGFDQKWWGKGNDTNPHRAPAIYQGSTATKVMETPTFRNLKNDHELITITAGPVKLDRIINSPVIYLLPEVYHKIMYMTSLLDDEITGLGTVEEIAPGKFLVDSMYLFDQKVSRARCEATGPMALVELCERMEKDGKDPAKMKVWWHSHNSMGVSPSSQDDETGRQFGANGYLISLISNHDGNMYSKMNIFKPLDMIIENIPVHRLDPKYSDEFIKSCKDEIEKYVKKETTSYVSSTMGFQHSPVESKLGEKTPLELAREELNKQGDIEVTVGSKDKDLGTNHPINIWGRELTENQIRYVWNDTTEKYDMFCQMTGKSITEDEVHDFGGFNYNDILDMPNDNPVDVDDYHDGMMGC